MLSLQRAGIIAAILGALLAGVGTLQAQVNGDATISAPALGSQLSVSTSSRFGGGISSIFWNGKEFVNDWDHGRQVSANASFFNRNECYNPYETGTKEDGQKLTTSSKLLALTASGNLLDSTTQMSWYLSTRDPRPGYGDVCGDPAQFISPVPPYTMALSDFDLVFFGGSGDLAMRKLLPAMYARDVCNDLPATARIICVGRDEMSQEAFIEMVETNAKHSFDQRFRVMKPSSIAVREALQDVLNLPEPPKRIECFDISHIQGTDKVGSMVVWEDGRMKKADYRKFIIRTVVGNDDFASMREVVTRRYQRLQEEKQPMPGLVLIDGGLGQLHSAAEALEAAGDVSPGPVRSKGKSASMARRALLKSSSRPRSSV